MVALLTLFSSGVAADSGGVSDEWIMAMVHRHCARCHSENPSHTMLLGQQPRRDDRLCRCPRCASLKMTEGNRSVSLCAVDQGATTVDGIEGPNGKLREVQAAFVAELR
jgi:hypothetical protein